MCECHTIEKGPTQNRLSSERSAWKAVKSTILRIPNIISQFFKMLLCEATIRTGIYHPAPPPPPPPPPPQKKRKKRRSLGAHFYACSTHLFVVRLFFQKVAKICNFWKIANFCDRVNPLLISSYLFLCLSVRLSFCLSVSLSLSFRHYRFLCLPLSLIVSHCSPPPSLPTHISAVSLSQCLIIT